MVTAVLTVVAWEVGEFLLAQWIVGSLRRRLRRRPR